MGESRKRDFPMTKLGNDRSLASLPNDYTDVIPTQLQKNPAQHPSDVEFVPIRLQDIPQTVQLGYDDELRYI